MSTDQPDNTAAVVVTIDGWRFTYHCGEYIEVTIPGQIHPEEVINVFDYEAGRPSIPCTPDAVDAAAREWFATADTAALFFNRDPRYSRR